MNSDKSKSKESLNHKDEEKVALKDAENEVDMTQTDESMLDSSKVHFINGTADAHIDIEGKTHLSSEFNGLTKEELQKYADDPYWVKVRWALLVLFWVAWIAMLAAAIAIIIVAPKCPPRPKLDWWQKSTVYQVYPKSFKDSDGDGVGDIKGIHSSLDHFESLNATNVLLGSIFASGGKDNGYDITDFTTLDPVFGTLEDFTSLKVAMHKKGMKVILDFVPNHSSDNHTWFQKSQAKEGDYADYYVWKPAGALPNNWKSVYGDSAWTLDPVRNEYYLHQFLPSQPDLNLRNEKVQQELKDVLLYWMNLGVDGFRVNAAQYLVEDANFADETEAGMYTQFQPESYELITSWREVLKAQEDEDTKPRFLMVEVSGTANQTSQFYKYEDKDGANMATNRALLDVKGDCNAQCISDLVNSWMEGAAKSGIWSNWQTGNQDTSRLATRLGKDDYINAMNMLLLTLPGTAMTYYGEEIGMKDNSTVTGGDPVGRDSYRTPMQWSDAANAGFTTGTPWLPVNSDYKERNVKAQRSHGAGMTNILVYSDVAKLRSEPSFQWGEFSANLKNDVYYYKRQAEGFPGYMVAINFGPNAATVDLTEGLEGVPVEGKVVTSTQNFDDHTRAAHYSPDQVIPLSGIFLKASEGVIITWSADVAQAA